MPDWKCCKTQRVLWHALIVSGGFKVHVRHGNAIKHNGFHNLLSFLRDGFKSYAGHAVNHIGFGNYLFYFLKRSGRRRRGD